MITGLKLVLFLFHCFAVTHIALASHNKTIGSHKINSTKGPVAVGPVGRNVGKALPTGGPQGRAPKVHRGAHPGPDYSEHSDVIFLIQRAGMSEIDFGHVKKFIGQTVQMMKTMGKNVHESRLAVDMFTDYSRNFINYKTCCVGPKSSLLYAVENKISLRDDSRFQASTDYTTISPDYIDIASALQVSKDLHLKGGLARRKPTLFVPIFNFQTPYMSFRLFDDAADKIRECKDTGAHIMPIIVDSERNRQPKSRAISPHRGRNAVPSRVEQFQSAGENSASEDEEFFRDKLQTFRTDTEILTAIVKDNPLKWRLRYGKRYLYLSKLYAQAMSSRPDHGLILSHYHELVSAGMLAFMKSLMENPMSFFGDGEIGSSCSDTKNLIDRSIWSPKYYEEDEYEDNLHCEWRLAARAGHRISLTFDAFDTEDMFDKVTVYDGFEKQHQLLGSFSGELTTNGKEVTVNSTEERISIEFRTDNGFRASGFHATWRPLKQPERIGDAFVVTLVDTSASVTEKDFREMAIWLRRVVKYFHFEGGIGYRSAKKRVQVKNQNLDSSLSMRIRRLFCTSASRRLDSCSTKL